MDRESLLHWIAVYDRETDALLDNRELEKDLGKKFKETGRCTKKDLKKIVEWKFDGPRLAGRRKLITAYIEECTPDFIARTTQAGFKADEDLNRLETLKLIKGVGNALASVILSFRNPEDYGVLDIHAWRELFGKEPSDLFQNPRRAIEFFDKLREIQQETGLPCRQIERALFTKNRHEAKRESKVSMLGYGEDFLTLLALTEHLDLILKQLKDDTDPADCLVFYRPSFGRAGLIGEFDAIIITSQTAYLLESKWDRSKMPNNTLKLDPIQTSRHEMFKWYHENWKGEDWEDFAHRHADEFSHKFEKNIAPKGSLLSQNLMVVLGSMRGRELRNVLLYFYRENIPQINTDFETVKIKYHPTYGNYIAIDRS